MLAPLQQEVASLKEQNAALQTARAAEAEAKAEADRQAQLESELDVGKMIENLGDAGEGESKFDRMPNSKLVEVISSAMDASNSALTNKLRSEIEQSI